MRILRTAVSAVSRTLMSVARRSPTRANVCHVSEPSAPLRETPASRPCAGRRDIRRLDHHRHPVTEHQSHESPSTTVAQSVDLVVRHYRPPESKKEDSRSAPFQEETSTA